MRRKEVLEAAQAIVSGAREEQYGRPEDNFTRIAALWGAYLGRLLTASDVAAMMVLFKVGRLSTGAGSDDTWVDIAGYAACGCEVKGRERA